MDDSGFLRQIAAQPHDDGLRAVYADWLEDQGDPRGEYIRLELELTGVERTDPRYPGLEERLRTVRMDIAEEWLAVVGRRYDVILIDYPREATIPTIKMVRTVAGRGLKEALDLVNQVPSTIKTGVSRAEAEQTCLLMETFFAGDSAAVRPTVALRVSRPT